MIHRRWLRTLGVPCAVAIAAWLAARTAADDADRSESVRAAIKSGPARNVILFIGDGMGDSEITAARNYAVGRAAASRSIRSH